MSQLHQQVKTAWTHAMEGGHDYLREYSDEDVALDMLAYDAELETEDLAAITAEVAKLRAEEAA